MREAIRWQSVGNPLAIRWQSVGNQVAIRWQSGGNPVAIRALSSSATGSYSKRARSNWGQSSGNQVAIKWQSGRLVLEESTIMLLKAREHGRFHRE
jgi:hypothetical protein